MTVPDLGFPFDFGLSFWPGVLVDLSEFFKKFNYMFRLLDQRYWGSCKHTCNIRVQSNLYSKFEPF